VDLPLFRRRTIHEITRNDTNSNLTLNESPGLPDLLFPVETSSLASPLYLAVLFAFSYG
jgi:hypothetical protein